MLGDMLQGLSKLVALCFASAKFRSSNAGSTWSLMGDIFDPPERTVQITRDNCYFHGTVRKKISSTNYYYYINGSHIREQSKISKNKKSCKMYKKS